MTDDKWRTIIYEPYLETWKILKLIQYADKTNNYDEQWERYMKEIDRLNSTYSDNPFVHDLIRMLLDAGDHIARINSKEHT